MQTAEVNLYFTGSSEKLYENSNSFTIFTNWEKKHVMSKHKECHYGSILLELVINCLHKKLFCTKVEFEFKLQICNIAFLLKWLENWCNKVLWIEMTASWKWNELSHSSILLQESFNGNEILRFVRYDNQLRLRNIEPFPTGKRKMKGYVVMNLYPWLLLAIFHHYR